MEPLTREQQEAAATFALAFIAFGAVALGLIGAAGFWVADKLVARQERVKAEAVDHVAEVSTMVAATPVRPRTDAPDSPDGQPAAPVMWTPTREQQLTLFRLMREYGIPREKARPALKAAGWVLSNDVWAAAAPPEPEADYVTPIAGRPTKRDYFQDEPALAYEPPPQPSTK